ncbi:SDR family NAD(P)-dependent oxidoreductase [Paenibacillus alginolyticus]|uniref:SDR family NAD(P)-dependent oxidoreductase n=1 Tax=Paenibacillus alginolyticus TaxID=59839 RepID=UPI0004204823|nr:SDR family NAD(P)-dependent oxidoreductase [Paenibacillus alginolyticus]MCY9668677.1 SDR family NAD(P)-dependent oxidoreductase [Paenibacillus alginolyticus]
MKYFIITGTSRGLGEELARRLLSPEHHLLCISRNRNVALMAESEQIDYFGFDLNDIDQVDRLTGMFDTSLQEEARSANKDVFAASELFNRVKDQGMLVSPTTIAEKLVDLLLSDQFAQGIVVEEL